MLRLVRSRGSAGHSRSCALRRRAGRSRTWLPRFRRLLALLHLNVKEIADRFVIDARYHVFKQNERFFLELDDGIFLRVAPQADALFQMVERQQMVFPLRIDYIEDDAAL